PVVARIAVVVRVLQQITSHTNERVVHAPSVHAEAFERPIRDARERALHLEPDTQDVPLDSAVLPNRLVGEPVDLLELDRPGVEASEHRPAALGAEVEGEILPDHAPTVSSNKCCGTRPSS